MRAKVPIQLIVSDTELAGANCRVNLTLPNPRSPYQLQVSNRNGRFDRIHIRGAYYLPTKAQLDSLFQSTEAP